MDDDLDIGPGPVADQSAQGLSRLLRKYAPTPFLIYRQRQLPGLQKQQPQAKVADLVKVLQAQWKDVDAESAEHEECVAISDLIRKQLRDTLVHFHDMRTWLSARQDMKQSMVAVGVRPPKFSRHLSAFGAGDGAQAKNFQAAWLHYSSDHCSDLVPSFARQTIDLFVLYRSVVSLGGFEHVCERQLWDTVVARQALECAATPTDRAASVILQVCYFRLLLEFELDYQVAHPEPAAPPGVVPSPPSSVTDLPSAAFGPSVFTNNYYKATGMTAILFSLRSRRCPDVLWALNHLLLISFNQNRLVQFNETPQLLEILVALIERQLLVVDLSRLYPRNVLPNLSQFAKQAQHVDHEIEFPDVIPVLLAVLRNLSFVASNQPRIALHHSCANDLLELAFEHDHACDILLHVSPYLDLTKVNFSTLSRWLHRTLIQVDNEAGVIRALHLLGMLTVHQPNATVLASQMHHEVINLVVSLLQYPGHDDVVLAALETISRLTATCGPAFNVRIVQNNDMVERLIALLLEPARESKVVDAVMRRTAASVLADLYGPEDNRVRFRPFLGSIFAAVRDNYESACFLAPILRASAAAR
ncbi:ARID domain-containing protein [Plasmodiophora brassicae]